MLRRSFEHFPKRPEDFVQREKFKLHSALILVVVFPLLALAGSSQRPERIQSGKDWLSWTPEQRFVFLNAYVAGYSRGKTLACIEAAKLFVPNEEITDVTKQASARCIDSAKSYSRSGMYYVRVVTDFYSICPKYDAAPLLYLMTLLSDDQLKSAEELCREGVRTEF
jgi:hypothetical protein